MVDEICSFLLHKSAVVENLFRLGKKDRPGDKQNTGCPRPVLVKFTVWDKRLILLSKQKLKEFRYKHIYVCQDLSQKERQARRSRIQPDPLTAPSNESETSTLTAHSNGSDNISQV